MAKVHLTIRSTYLPKWGVWEGIRELIQNGRDAEVEHKAKFSVDWRNDRVYIENEGVTLPIQSLLMGYTSKADRTDLIGHFGEGLKLGVLALVRAGCAVKIRNGSEVWFPSLEKSDLFDEDVLTFDIQKGRADKNRVCIEVGPITKEAWADLKRMFLFLTPAENVPTSYGEMLLDEAYQGKVFVKGIFVQNDPTCKFGYNLRDGELDRDRRMVASWNLQYYTRNILMEALSKQKNLIPVFVDLLETPSTETRSIDEHSHIPDDVSEAIGHNFRQMYGDDAVPVRSITESQSMEHLGKRGIVVSQQLRAVLTKVYGTPDDLKKSLQKEVTRKYSWSDLTETEKSNLDSALCLIHGALPHTNDVSVHVVDFRSETLEGQFADGEVYVARRMVTQFYRLMEVLVHEFAHAEGGGDGTIDHVRNIEACWCALFRLMHKDTDSALRVTE